LGGDSKRVRPLASGATNKRWSVGGEHQHTFRQGSKVRFMIFVVGLLLFSSCSVCFGCCMQNDTDGVHQSLSVVQTTSKQTNVHSFKQRYKHSNIQTYKQTYIQTYMHACIRAYIQTYIQTHTHKRANIHTNEQTTYEYLIQIYTQTNKNRLINKHTNI
jgi:hypothetical protein